MSRQFSVTLWVTVHDEAALAEAADAYVLAERVMSLDEWHGMRGDGSRDSIKDDLQMLLDPGVSPAGCEIEESVIEEADPLPGDEPWTAPAEENRDA